MPEPASIALVGTGFAGLVVRFVQKQYHLAKGYIDKVVSALLLLMFAPVIGLCALLVKLTSRGPAFYRQERVGAHGRTFTLLKIRTMRENAEAETGPVWAQGDDDPRVTPLGRFLRKTYLDELPQLVNVLRGEMSLVGPRPERPYFVERLKPHVPDYEKRLTVKPGITGLAQIRAEADRTLRDVRRKVKLDCLYIHRMCWWVDFVILFGTVARIFGLGKERRGSQPQDGQVAGEVSVSSTFDSET